MRRPQSTPGRKSGRLTQPAGGYAAGSGLLFGNEPSAFNTANELLTATEVAKLLRISLSGVRRLREKRCISFIKVGGGIRYAKDDVAAYLSHARVKALGQ